VCNRFEIMQTDDAKDLPLPRYMSEGAAGMDLYANVTEDVVLAPNEILLVPTGICIALPIGFEAQIRPRSGLALKHGVTLVNTPGTVDSDYRGEIKVIMTCLGHEPFVIRRGDRIAQMVVAAYMRVDWAVADSLADTERGAGGFGHTGQK